MVIKSIRALGVLVHACERNMQSIYIDYTDDPEYRNKGLVNTMCIPLPNGYWVVLYSNHDKSVDSFSGEVYDPEAWDNEIMETGTISINLLFSDDVADLLLDDWHCGDPDCVARYSYAKYGEAPKEFTFSENLSSE